MARPELYLNLFTRRVYARMSALAKCCKIHDFRQIHHIRRIRHLAGTLLLITSLFAEIFALFEMSSNLPFLKIPLLMLFIENDGQILTNFPFYYCMHFWTCLLNVVLLKTNEILFVFLRLWNTSP